MYIKFIHFTTNLFRISDQKRFVSNVENGTEAAAAELRQFVNAKHLHVVSWS
jgi:hypothetical protein